MIEIEIDHTVETEIEKILDLTIGDNYKTDTYNVDMTIGKEVLDVKNCDNIRDSRDRGRKNFRRNVSNDRYDSRDRNRSRMRQRSLTLWRNNRRHDSPNTNLGTRNRSHSRVTRNRDRVKCYRYREYDHFANECPNTVADDSDGYESDRAALQLITAEPEVHNFDATRQKEEHDYLNFERVRMLPPHFCLRQRKVDE